MTLKELKATIGRFQQEVKSNSITDLVVWLECQTAYAEELDKKHKEDMLYARKRKAD